MAGTLPASSSSAAAATTSSSPPTSPGIVSKWTSEQDKLFEKALLNWEEDESPKWEELAALVPGKTAAEVKKHFEFLVQDVKNIEAGLIPLPCYTARDALVKEQSSSSPTGVESKKTPLTSSGGLFHHHHHHHHANGGSGNTSAANPSNVSNATGGTSSTSKTKAQDQERRKGIPWTEDEHRLFLLGLEKFGKGDWRSISRNFVVSRTPTQVASHAQKYFIRLNSIHKDKRRTSIHDITSVNGDGRQQTQGPITGQTPSGGSGGGGGNPPPATGAAVGQPYTPVGPAVGTPVVPMNQPVPVSVHHPGAYPAGARSRPVPGTPLNVPHMAYPMPQPAMHH